MNQIFNGLPRAAGILAARALCPRLTFKSTRGCSFTPCIHCHWNRDVGYLACTKDRQLVCGVATCCFLGILRTSDYTCPFLLDHEHIEPRRLGPCPKDVLHNVPVVGANCFFHIQRRKADERQNGLFCQVCHRTSLGLEHLVPFWVVRLKLHDIYHDLWRKYDKLRAGTHEMSEAERARVLRDAQKLIESVVISTQEEKDQIDAFRRFFSKFGQLRMCPQIGPAAPLSMLIAR